MRTITIDIINDKALNLLMELEQLKLIRLRKEKKGNNANDLNFTKYKGAMSKESINVIDHQLKTLRREWE